ncbi:hypothetical protein [Shinella sp.]|uniref:hypothetical protein n=1 Tax=Shinella sp. TaxID=1870904 RepID=UPI0029A14301|nr:hypothetical protein [Shinella sp.]MDX3978590.1 hypothetical protein [Shinella sp.]
MVHQKLGLAHTKEVADAPQVSPGRQGLTAQIFVELLAVDLQTPAYGRDGGMIATEESEILGEGLWLHCKNTYPRADDVNVRPVSPVSDRAFQNRRLSPRHTRFEASFARSKDEAEVIAEAMTDTGEDGPC